MKSKKTEELQTYSASNASNLIVEDNNNTKASTDGYIMNHESQKCDMEEEGAENGNDTDENRSSRSSSTSKELARLQFYGAGPKMANLPTNKGDKTRGLKLNWEQIDPLEKYVCEVCRRNDVEDKLLICNGCDMSYHTFCLEPPLSEVPHWDWSCQDCVFEEVSKPHNPLGFEYTDKEYTLQTYGDMANKFKSDYFQMEGNFVPTSVVEEEYWKILNNIESDVMVEYGADQHTLSHGSGFPRASSETLAKDDLQYVSSDWNLNNLPVLPNSILRYIDVDINGMKLPWIYVGMCFSTFCWHTEDHWTPSINYLHFGEPKTWYGVPSSYAEKMEAAMRKAAPELFKAQPDIIHDMVTTINPNVLEAFGVPVYRTDQCAGEFIITWPRAYHAGFNQGFNLAEAVNFAPPEWLEMGRASIENYSLIGRHCVFSYDELVCDMASKAERLTYPVAAAAYQNLVEIIELERLFRKQLLEGGVKNVEREAFEILPDDERQCSICNTTCFLSAMIIDNDVQEIFCLRHFKSLKCDPGKVKLYYRYTVDELVSLLENLKKEDEVYNKWMDEVRKHLNSEDNIKVDIAVLKLKLVEFKTKKFPKSELSDALSRAITEAEQCLNVIKRLRNRRLRSSFTLSEIELFSNQIQNLPVRLEGSELVKDLHKEYQILESNM